MLSKNNKIRLQALGLFLVSPIYVPIVVCWEYRKDIIDFYEDCWKIATNTHNALEKKQDDTTKTS